MVGELTLSPAWSFKKLIQDEGIGIWQKIFSKLTLKFYKQIICKIEVLFHCKDKQWNWIYVYGKSKDPPRKLPLTLHPPLHTMQQYIVPQIKIDDWQIWLFLGLIDNGIQYGDFIVVKKFVRGETMIVNFDWSFNSDRNKAKWSGGQQALEDIKHTSKF